MCGFILDALILMGVLRLFSEDEQSFSDMLIIAAPAAIVGVLVQIGLATAMVGSGFVGIPALIILLLATGLVQLIVLGLLMVLVLKVDFKPAMVMALVFFLVRSLVFGVINFMFMKN